MKLLSFRWGRSKLYQIIIILIFLSFVFVADGLQQKQFADIEKAYLLVEKGEYDAALPILENYRQEHSKIYFYLQKCINGNESIYTSDKIDQIISICRQGN